MYLEYTGDNPFLEQVSSNEDLFLEHLKVYRDNGVISHSEFKKIKRNEVKERILGDISYRCGIYHADGKYDCDFVDITSQHSQFIGSIYSYHGQGILSIDQVEKISSQECKKRGGIDFGYNCGFKSTDYKKYCTSSTDCQGSCEIVTNNNFELIGSQCSEYKRGGRNGGCTIESYKQSGCAIIDSF